MQAFESQEALELDALDLVSPPVSKAAEPKYRSPLAHLIMESAQGQSPVLAEWAEKVLPGILMHLSLIHAKGMSREEMEALGFLKGVAPKWREQVATKLEAMGVQSLAVHILNAALSAWTVVELAGLGELEQRLYLAGVTLHDLNKIVERQLGEALKLEGEKAERYKQEFLVWGERLGLWNFIGREYWLDVAFLAQNAEAVRGENRTLLNYGQLKSDPVLLEDLSEFVRLADLIASEAKHPDDLPNMRGSNKVPQVIQRALRGRYVLRYHRTAENRGLLTQVIHNVVRERVEVCGWVPLLFFPDGITYMVPKGAPDPDLSDLPSLVRAKLINAVSTKLKELVTRGPLGIKFAPEFVELLGPREAAELLIQRTLDIINDAKLPVTEERKAKTQLRRGASVTLDLSYPASLNADRVAEGMFALSKLLEAYFGGPREEHGERLIRALGLEVHTPVFHSIEFTGGAGYPWYYIGGHFAEANPGLLPVQLEERMLQSYAKVLEELGEPEREPPFGFLDAYLSQVLSLGESRKAWDFGGELARYERNKAPRSGERICAICNSPFETREDFSAFSNKKRVSPKVESARGICAVCQAEELLRRFSLGKEMWGEGSTIFLHLYPAYFFTPVTARAMRQAYGRFKNANFFDIIRHLQENGFEVDSLACADVFQVLEPPNDKRRLHRVSYPEGDMHGYYLLGVPFLGLKPTDTESWAMPALLGLITPVIFGVKVVASPSAIPIYTSGADFPNEMMILDRPHSFWVHGMKRAYFGLSELEAAIKAACALYGLVSEAYRDSAGFPIWNQLGTVSRAIDTDSLAIFGYADRIQHQQTRGKGAVTTTDGMAPFLAKRLSDYYCFFTNYCHRVLKEEGSKMGLIEGLVDHYAMFYRASGRAAYARLRPLTEAARVVLESPPELDRESLHLQIEGVILALLDRILDRSADGWVPPEARPTAERARLVKEFAGYFLTEIFEKYCQGDRALLRQRLNLLKNGAEAVYIQKYGQKQAGKANNKDEGGDI